MQQLCYEMAGHSGVSVQVGVKASWVLQHTVSDNEVLPASSASAL